MKAIIRKKYSSFENLSVGELPIPSPKDNQILVNVKATTINRTDTSNVRGFPFIVRFFTGFSNPRYVSPGSDFAGIVEELGKEVKRFKVGDRVFGFNDNGIGSQAQYFCCSQSEVVNQIPKDYSFQQAAASLEGFHYAVNCVNKISIQAGQKIMVNGASGAIGSALIQILKYKGCKVNAVANQKNKAFVKSCGVDLFYDYEKEDFTEVDKNKYDFILDAVGKSTFGKCKPLLKERGIYISSELGPLSENIFLALRSKIYGKKKVVFPIPSDIASSVKIVLEMMSKNQFKPLIEKEVGLNQIHEIYKYVNAGKKYGNVILNPWI